MYNQLPSRVAAEATTFDLMVADVYTTWEKHKANPESTEVEYDTDALSKMMQAAKE